MRYVLISLRALLVADTLLGILLLPLVLSTAVILLLRGHHIAATAIALSYATIGTIYGRYWRRFPFRLKR